MSSSQKTRQSKRMSSIVRRLEWQLVKTKIGLYLIEDILIFFLLCVWWAVQKEYETLGEINVHLKRMLVYNGGIKNTTYRVVEKSGAVVLETGIYPVLKITLGVVLLFFIVQGLSIAFSMYHETRKIRKILRPINELALKADELSKLTVRGDQYQLIEHAIDNIQPEDDSKIKLQSAELAGIEAAVNNLLVRLRESYRQQTRFVNDASHELRTPIAVIQGYANMLERWGKTDEKVLDESIAAIVHEADHMNKLVEQLLFLARGDSGKTTLHPEPVDLNALMQEIYEESFMIDEAHPYRFRNCEETITTMADPMLLKQAVRILVDNAAKYTKEKDEIVLGVGKNEGGHPYLLVQDTGIGMAESDVEHMFERFYRADDARSFQGTGLGLSIAKWIVDQHRGHFEILSRTELGTRIMIVLGE